MKGLAVLSMLALIPAAALANTTCLTDAEIEAALGDQVRAKAFFIDSRVLPDRPLCSGLTLAQHIQRMRAAAFPEEGARAQAQQAELIARDTARAAPAPVIAESAPEIASPPPARPVSVIRARSPARPAATRKAARRDRPMAAVSRQSSQSYFSSCREARAAGAAPIRRGQAGYSGRLDRDGDGVACE